MAKIITHNIKDDQYWMQKALELARQAEKAGEVPVGAIVVLDQKIIGRGFNLRETNFLPTAHAEIRAIEKAAKKLQAWRLLGATMYVTLEPCVMCSGALILSRIERLVYGAQDQKGGGIQSLYQIGNDPRLNHQLKITAGVLEKECSEILKNFFKKRRLKKRLTKL